MKALLALSFLALAPLAALAQDHSAHHAMPAANDSPSNTAFAAVNEKMHAAMEIPLSGDTDIDFIAGMIPHHQGAVDMARVVLEYGKDPQVRAFAEEILKTQEAEIEWMEAWLAEHLPADGHDHAPPPPKPQPGDPDWEKHHVH